MIIRNRNRNQLGLAPIRIPETVKSFIERSPSTP